MRRRRRSQRFQPHVFLVRAVAGATFSVEPNTSPIFWATAKNPQSFWIRPRNRPSLLNSTGHFNWMRLLSPTSMPTKLAIFGSPVMSFRADQMSQTQRSYWTKPSSNPSNPSPQKLVVSLIVDLEREIQRKWRRVIRMKLEKNRRRRRMVCFMWPKFDFSPVWVFKTRGGGEGKWSTLCNWSLTFLPSVGFQNKTRRRRRFVYST